MRQAWTVIHRWAGLFMAAFLVFSGLTGAVISWDHELDDWINPELMHARTEGRPLPALELVRRVEQRHPQVRASFFPLQPEPGDSFSVFVTPRVDPATGRLFEPGFNQVFLDPATGDELGRREWGAVWPVTKENVVSFLYRLHYTLHLPEFLGIDRWGIWLLGVVAVVWTLDCFVGFYLTLPARRRAARRRDDDVGGDAVPPSGKGWWARWSPAWKVRWGSGSTKLNFDLHRAVSLWTWALLFIVAFTAFSLNLYREVFFPLMSKVSQVTPTPFDQRRPADRHRPITPTVTWQQVIDIGRAEGLRRGFDPLGALSYSDRYGIYQARYFKPEDDHGVGGAGPTRLFIDGLTGEVLGQKVPWTGTAADIFVQAQFPLHSGRILGLPGRILISVMGVVVALLSITGVVIWWRKRTARMAALAREASRRAPAGPVLAK
ncbi:PepSY domain-containing protein [Aquabacterium sp. J223]|uniref:PepSY-associated TM helix domain-containing protein n=1 Tax=Aquabacterium sp. J223 TaxID=2898431 RepID=UPI0021AE00E6|nr:PepSY-associated TM helix domain-containing protein [Aquabacterium sp. J223]UUX94465.1 PepSY domain-containing protein [Aquabacterium sp. J223]